MRKPLIEIKKESHTFTKDALLYLGKKGIKRIKTLYRDPSTNNWLMAFVEGDYYIALANVEGCKSSVFGSVSHTMSIYSI